MRNAPNPTLEAKEQYHHYIPRFVLRAFAAQPQPSLDESTRPFRKKRKQRKKKPARIAAGDAEAPGGGEDDSHGEVGPCDAPQEPEPPVETEVAKDKGKSKPRKPRYDPDKDPYIKFYDLESGVLDYCKVGRAYGIPDMYKDADHERAYHIEELLSKLESNVAIIYGRIRKRHENGERKFTITRADRNLLRKFLFVMRYRSHKFWSKYTGTIEDYKRNDRDMLIEFLKGRSITDLRQVWLLNLEVILRTEIDADKEWLKTIGREMFPADANMYVFHMSESYMAFCEPQSPEDEFVITDNGFGIFEGPVKFDTANLKSTGADGSPPRLKDPAFTEYHKLGPLSPRLILVLRSNFLRDEPIWEKRLKFFREWKAWPKADSLLQDLPIKPPEIRYWLPGKREPIYTLDDEFTFEIHKANTKQVYMINTLLIQEATGSITWVSDKSLVKSLEASLANPSFMLDTPLGVFPEFTPRFALRYQKQRLLSLWDKPYPSEGMRPLEEYKKMNETLRQNKSLQSYYKLGGAPELFRYDSHQAILLSEFRAFTAEYSGPVISWRNQVNKATTKFMCALHPRIIWFHVKMWKASAHRQRKGLDLDTFTESDTDLLEFGPEDLIANLMDFLPFRILSWLMIETSLKGMHRLDNREKLIEQGVSREELESSLMLVDMGMMNQFGGFGSSWSVVGTPYHYEPVDFRDPFTPEVSPDILTRFYEQDLLLRTNLRGNIEKVILGTRGTPEVYKWLSQLLWDHLYPIPESLLN